MPPQNLLLAHLPREVYNRIEPDLKLLSLPHGQVVHRAGEEIQDMYFPLTCMISVTVRMNNGGIVEAGAIGSREVVGINAFMGGHETTQTEYIVQLPGDAMKIAVAPLKVEFNRNSEMRAVMLKYTQAFIAQISQNVACNRLHEIDQRFARWLLEVRDRVRSDDFPLTHEFISEMLGVRRASVSDVAMKLKNKGIIEYTRGSVKIADIVALETMSCECYAALREEYNRLLPSHPSNN